MQQEPQLGILKRANTLHLPTQFSNFLAFSFLFTITGIDDQKQQMGWDEVGSKPSRVLGCGDPKGGIAKAFGSVKLDEFCGIKTGNGFAKQIVG